jgi:hypothetical protein
MYVPRKQGGRVLMQLETAHAVESTKYYYYYYILQVEYFAQRSFILQLSDDFFVMLLM